MEDTETCQADILSGNEHVITVHVSWLTYLKSEIRHISGSNQGIVGVVVTWIVATERCQLDPPRVRFPDNAETVFLFFLSYSSVTEGR